MAIQVRRGNYNDFDPTRMVAGEFAVCLDNEKIFITISPGNVIELGNATVVNNYAQTSEAWAVGTRGGEEVESTDPTYHNNAKYWAEQSNQIRFTDSRDASATTYGCQTITVNNVEYAISGSIYMERTLNVTAGVDTTFTFTNNIITENSAIDVWASIYGIAPTDVEVSNGSCSVTFNLDETTNLTCRIYIR